MRRGHAFYSATEDDYWGFRNGGASTVTGEKRKTMF